MAHFTTRSQSAFLFSAEKLEAETGQFYMWTFTFREVPLSDDWALEQWKKGCENGKRHFVGVHGLRVVELHRSHGIHFHLLLNKRFPVERMFQIFWPLGFGRINVVKADAGSAAYLAKYLSKESKRRLYVGRRRLWAAFGGFKGTKCKDIEFAGAFQRNKFLLVGLHFKSKGAKAAAYWLLIGCSLFGDWKLWSAEIKHRFLCGVGKRLTYTPECETIACRLEVDEDYLAELRELLATKNKCVGSAAGRDTVTPGIELAFSTL